MATDKKFAAANKDTFTTNIKGASTPAAASFRRANALGLGDTEDVVRKVFSALNDPKLRKEAKEYADTASGMSKNLKELNDISSDYIISITNQSKELKALNAFSTSSAQAIKLLDKNDLTKSGANIQEFLSGITDQFEEMSGISLPADLELLRTRLNRLQEDVNNNYKTAMELAGSDKDLQKKAEDDRAKSLSQGTSSLLGSYGGIEKVQQDYIGYSLKASKSLADLATAAGRASLAQTSLSAKLKETQFYGSFSKEGEARAIREARKTEEKIANIQIKAEKTNAAAIDAQKSNTEQQLRTALSLASKELFKNSKSNNPSPLGTGSVKDQAIQALSVKELDGSIASQILSLVNSLESLGAASVIATLKIDSIRASLGKARESEARAEFKETDAEADKKFKPEEDKLFEELNNLEKKSQSIALLDSSYLSARVDSEINLIKAKADILQYEKDLAIKIGEYNTLVEQLIKDPTNVSIGEAVVGKARARDEAFKKGEPLRDLPKVIQDEENLRIRKTNLEITEKLSDNLSEQVDLASSYSDYLLSVSTNYSKIAEFNTVSTQTLLEQYSIQERILEAQIAIEKSKVGDIEAEQKIVDLQQQHLAFKLDTHQKLTDLFKKETELSLKIREQSGRASDIFGTEGLQEAITIAMDRIEETTGKSKSVMSQLATGIVDSADIIVDSFTTMIQKMDETKLTFKAFSDMVRNTLSDMFRDMASDAFKNAMKSGIKLLAANFGYDTRTNQEKAASALQITANSSLDQLKLIQQDMRALLQALVPGKIDPIAQQGIDLDKQYNLDWEKANKANDTGVRTSPYPYPTSASIMSRQLDGVSSIGATSASAGTYDPLVQAVSSTASSAKETNRLLNEIAQKINPSSIPVPDVIQPPAMQDSSTPILSKTATTNIEKGGTKIDVAADKFNMATTVMHGAVGALVGALATGGSAKGALGGILMGVATSVISGGITGGLTSIFAKAKGGIVGPLGDMPLHKYARGGIATSPQMALFGEGSKNEAYVPLPDNRSIPVTLKGGSGGATFGDTNITVTVTNSGSVDTSISADQATNLSKALSVSIKATIQEELMKQMKPRGMLHG
jgi:hypothetical protein